MPNENFADVNGQHIFYSVHGAGKPLICPGYTDPEYPWHCTLDPDDMARAIIECWEGYDKINYRQWAEQKHDVMSTIAACESMYNRYL